MSKKLGDLAEEKAAEYLRNEGFTVVERNFYSRFGEIDIIAKKGDTYHFIEVKSGSGYDPVYNITAAKLKKIIKTLNIYCKSRNITSAYTIDAVIVTDRIEFIENLTIT